MVQGTHRLLKGDLFLAADAMRTEHPQLLAQATPASTGLQMPTRAWQASCVAPPLVFWPRSVALAIGRHAVVEVAGTCVSRKIERMKFFRHRRPSHNSLLGITRAKDRVRIKFAVHIIFKVKSGSEQIQEFVNKYTTLTGSGKEDPTITAGVTSRRFPLAKIFLQWAVRLGCQKVAPATLRFIGRTRRMPFGYSPS